jgi:hypothetical protein
MKHKISCDEKGLTCACWNEPANNHGWTEDYLIGYQRALEDAIQLVRTHGASKIVIERLRNLSPT